LYVILTFIPLPLIYYIYDWIMDYRKGLATYNVGTEGGYMGAYILCSCFCCDMKIPATFCIRNNYSLLFTLPCAVPPRIILPVSTAFTYTCLASAVVYTDIILLCYSFCLYVHPCVPFCSFCLPETIVSSLLLAISVPSTLAAMACCYLLATSALSFFMPAFA
jgi:hypothetical protein